MATYFHANSEIQAACGGGSGGGGAAGSGEGLQTLILMNPTGHGYNVGYSDSPQPPGNNNFFFLNSNPPGGGDGDSGNPFNAPPSSQPQQLLGIPLTSPTNQSSSATSSQQDISLLQYAFLPRAQYNYNQKAMDHVEAARDTSRAQRGLSLSLSSQLPAYGVNNGMHNHVLLSPKYLKAAQELLDEVVNVGKSGFNKAVDDGQAGKSEQQPSSKPETGGGEGGSGWDKGGKRGGELTTSEKQEIQMKKAKLVYMLDEVEQRYREYHQQIHMVASTFEQVGGIGSAKPYTALALKTISKQFRSIKDAILCQVKAASKSLREEEEQEDDCLMGGGNNNNNNNNNNNIKKGSSSSSSSSRMKYVDNQLRQQRALQQLGMVHHNAWRPQRGLPERSVSVLRSWLFEHFLHPYPKDSDKIMLAKQAGLTRGQVSNWFINARVRLWKPMVEEMYSEEMKEQEKNGSEEMKEQEKNGSEENPDKNEQTAFKNPKETSIMENPNKSYDVLNQTGDFGLIGSPELGSTSNENPKKQGSSDMFPSISMDTAKPDESDNEHLSMKFDTDKQSREDGFSLLGGPTNFINGGFSTYPFAELGRLSADNQFPSPYSGNNNGVSLSLGLPHCENLAMSGSHQTFVSNQNIELAREVEIGDARDYRTITAFGNTRGLMQNYYHQAL